MNLAEFSVKNSLFVNLLSLFLLLAGIFALFGLNREAFPVFSFDVVVVLTPYPGASAPEVEKLVTIPLEEEIRGVDGIDDYYSQSLENYSYILVNVDPDHANPDKVVRNIQRAVDRVRDLPDDAEDPEVSEPTTLEFPVIEISLSGDLPEAVLQEQAELLERRIEEIEGLSRVERTGWRNPEIWVEVDQEKLRSHYVSPEEVMEALKARNVNLPGGKIRTGEEEINIRVLGEFRTPGEVEEVIIRANDVGNWLRVGDVARASWAFEDEDESHRTEGSRAIRLVLIKKETGDAIAVVDEARRIVEEFGKSAPAGLKIVPVNDLSFYIRRRLGVLANNGIIGVILVLLSLFIFLSRPVAFFTALGMPIAFFTTFAIMAYFGISINLITLFGLILVLGMIVDDGIIISENVYRHIEEGMEPRRAAIAGTAEVIKPVAATILTTIAAFSPLLFMSGLMGKFIRGIPLVVIAALSASALEAFVILPSHLADFVRAPKRGKDGRLRTRSESRWFKGLVGGYIRLLNLALRFRYLTLALFLALLVACGGLVLSPRMKLILFPQVGIEQFFIRAEAKPGTDLEKTRSLLEPIEELAAGLNPEELDTYLTLVGAVQNDPGDPFRVVGSHVGQVHVLLTPAEDRTRDAEEIIADLRGRVGDGEGWERIYFDKIRHGPPVGKAVAAEIRGDDLEVSAEIAGEVKAYLEAQPGVSDISDDLGRGKDEIEIVIDEELAARAGLTVGRIGASIRNAVRGGKATVIRPEKAEEEIDVLVRFPPGERSRVDIFDSLPVPNRYGKLIPLSAVSRLERRDGLSLIKHHKGRRVVTVTANVDETVTSSAEVNRALAENFSGLPDRYPGYSISGEGEWEETRKSLASLARAFAIAFFLVFMILAALFGSILQPFIVMTAIPFGMIGVVIGFYCHDLPLSFMSLLGVVGLSGVVVNDSIVLVQFINELRKKGTERRPSIIEAGRLRLRPVILTTVTTVLGLISVAYMIGGGDPFIRPAAMAIVWGLSFATLLTLILIPCIYAVADDIVLKLLHHGLIKPKKGSEPKKGSVISF